MSSRSRRRVSRGCKPGGEHLEGRWLLAAQLSGVDLDGDRWVLQVQGAGDLQVVNQLDADGNEVPLGEPALIESIRVTGTNPLVSRLVGVVERGPNGDGKVFFQQLEQFGGETQLINGQAGLLAIDMPNFWLGTTQTEPTAGGEQGSIAIPDGVVTLRFGGVDTTAFFGSNPNLRLDSNGQADRFTISLGLPNKVGTSIIVDEIITSAQDGTSNVGQTTVIQDTVNLNVSGRLNLFEANRIRGDAERPPTPFSGEGGTNLTVLPTVGNIPAAAGEIRVNGDATNFTARLFATPNDTFQQELGRGAGVERLNTFFVGGEATNVTVTTPSGIRNVRFGRGMDTVLLGTHVIENLEANRGAINSKVVVSRTIGRATFGGDVIDTEIYTGYRGLPGGQIRAQIGGGMTVLVGGEIRNSIFAASVEPQSFSDPNNPRDSGFGTSADLVIPLAAIDAKVAGPINNSDVVPLAPDKAFFASSVRLERGPVVPPKVNEPPYSRPLPRPRSVGVPVVRASRATPRLDGTPTSAFGPQSKFPGRLARGGPRLEANLQGPLSIRNVRSLNANRPTNPNTASDSTNAAAIDLAATLSRQQEAATSSAGVTTSTPTTPPEPLDPFTQAASSTTAGATMSHSDLGSNASTTPTNLATTTTRRDNDASDLSGFFSGMDVI